MDLENMNPQIKKTKKPHWRFYCEFMCGFKISVVLLTGLYRWISGYSGYWAPGFKPWSTGRLSRTMTEEDPYILRTFFASPVYWTTQPDYDWRRPLQSMAAAKQLSRHKRYYFANVFRLTVKKMAAATPRSATSRKIEATPLCTQEYQA